MVDFYAGGMEWAAELQGAGRLGRPQFGWRG